MLLVSDAQNKVLELLENNNVIVDSSAGSGKTTTSLSIAQKFSDCTVLLLTYNSRLRLETIKRTSSNNILNLECHTYHSFANRYYKWGYTDSTLLDILTNNYNPNKILNYDIFIFDECQDMTMLYFEFVNKIYKDNQNKNAKICILGDKYQCIYEFKGADSRFITSADKIFTLNSYEWKTTTLSTSFRITNTMANFINFCLGYNRISSVKNSVHKPRYLICNPYFDAPLLEVIYYLNLGYKVDEIFIIAYSISKDKTPIKLLENKLVEMNVPIYFPISDDVKLDDEILQNKLVFSTFHQVKGLERKVVILFGFDTSLFDFYKKDVNKNVCPNELYVGLSRATERISVIQDSRFEHFKFIDPILLYNYCSILTFNSSSKKKTITPKVITDSVSSFIKYMPSNIISECLALCSFEYVQQRSKLINVPSKSQQKYGWEDVSDINGVAIVSYYEYLTTHKMSICKDPITSLTIEELLQYSNKWIQQTCMVNYKMAQITNYDWLNTKILDNCIESIKKLGLSHDSLYEVPFAVPIKDSHGLNGIVDCIDIDNKTVWEFKCVKQLLPEHYLQLILYMFMLNSSEYTDYSYKLYNILSGELVQIKCSIENLSTIIDKLYNEKYIKKKNLNNYEFLQQTALIKTSISSRKPYSFVFDD